MIILQFLDPSFLIRYDEVYEFRHEGIILNSFGFITSARFRPLLLGALASGFLVGFLCWKLHWQTCGSVAPLRFAELGRDEER